MKYKSQTFKETTIQLDGNTFELCKFIDCILEYSGGKPPSMVNCSLSNSSFAFIDQAGDTVQFMTAMYHGGFKNVIEQTFDKIKNPNKK